MVMTGTHDGALVALSILIAIAASFTALDLASRVRAATGWARHAWLGTAAVAMGGGIWAMHFVAMLAFRMPGMAVDYAAGPTLLSLVVPIAVTAISFAVVSRGRTTPWLLLCSGLFMGLGIVAMHLIGMAAMRMDAAMQHDPGWIAVSVLIAVGAATVALWLSLRTSRLPQRLLAALAMGVAVSGMHYSAMRGAVFVAAPHPPGADHAAHTAGAGGMGPVSLALAVAAATFLILFLALVAAMFDRRFALLAEREAQTLRDSEERFRSLYRRSPLPLLSMDRQGQVEEVSEAWLTLLGYGREEVLGRPLITFLAEASVRQAVQVDWPVLLATGELRDREYRIVTRGGEFLDVSLSARLEEGGDGVLRVLAGMANVTERKRAEDALRQAQKIEAIGQLTGGVAHDFNNLLAVVLGNLELLRKRLPAGDARALRFLDNAVGGAQRGAGLTQRLLAFARRQDLRPEAVELPALVHGMADLLQRSLGPVVQVETEFPAGLPPALVDANQLELVLLNLAVNARDAMPAGGVLGIAAAAVTVPGGAAAQERARAGSPGVGTAGRGAGGMDSSGLGAAGMGLAGEGAAGSGEGGNGSVGGPGTGNLGMGNLGAGGDVPPGGLLPGDYLRLRVTDSGHGMDAATLARATEPFFSTKGLGKGTGLGLSMAQGLAAQSGGRLVLRSVPGRGTTAELWLPAATAEQAARPAEVASALPPVLPAMAPLSVLVVDDDPLVLSNTAAMLEDLGHAVLRAASGAEALALLRDGSAVQLVVTDQAMPGMTGTQLARTLRREWPALPVLLVSGYAERPADAADLPRLNKPFPQAALAQAAEALVRQAERDAAPADGTLGAAIIPLRARPERGSGAG